MEKKYAKKEIRFVQFTHPGGEHHCSVGRKDFNDWNYGTHKRKFLRAQGSIVENGSVMENQDLIFWGEWEPRSAVVPIKNVPSKGRYPHFIHTPKLDLNAPKENENKKSRVDTDPFVFADRFYYRGCRQSSSEKLRKLERGSLILFGSILKENPNNPYFAIDTVFVVDEMMEYYEKNYNGELDGFVPDNYTEIEGIEKKKNSTKNDKLCCNGKNCKPYDGPLTCYAGAIPANNVGGMYSFVPCMRYEDGTQGFERLKILQSDLAKVVEGKPQLITDNLIGFKTIGTNIEENFAIWNKIRKMTKKAGLLEGVSFKY